mmetsp:Transcript_11414/g.31835  ORF Transcript_11414/g.31835 Transcript_11414/m.31835 type:complete len:184 (+) Transcript_11414:42-593(+)
MGRKFPNFQAFDPFNDKHSSALDSVLEKHRDVSNASYVAVKMSNRRPEFLLGSANGSRQLNFSYAQNEMMHSWLKPMHSSRLVCTPRRIRTGAYIPKGLDVHQRRELSFVADFNAMAKPFKEQRAANFFSRDTLKPSASPHIDDADPPIPLRVPSRTFEESPREWEIYALQCFLSGNKARISL